jgi:hypothetical protein
MSARNLSSVGQEQSDLVVSLIVVQFPERCPLIMVAGKVSYVVLTRRADREGKNYRSDETMKRTNSEPGRLQWPAGELKRQPSSWRVTLG